MTGGGERIRELQVVLLREGDSPRRIATIRLGKSDASVYIFPHSPTGTYYYGSSQMAERQAKITFSFSDQEIAFEMPHVSIHESGRVHITVNRHRRGVPLSITPLVEGPTGHLATVRADTIADLPTHDADLRMDGQRRDWPVVVPSGIESCRVVLRLRKGSESVRQGTALVSLLSPRLAAPLFLCLEVHEDEPIGLDGGQRGVTVVAGWNPVPTAPASLDEVAFLFLRAQ
jgi:hypothetical protein